MGCVWGAPTEQLWLDAEAIAGILGTPSPKLAVIVDILPPALTRGPNPWHCQLAFGEGQPGVPPALPAGACCPTAHNGGDYISRHGGSTLCPPHSPACV